jgi:hypothetical protein
MCVALCSVFDNMLLVLSDEDRQMSALQCMTCLVLSQPAAACLPSPCLPHAAGVQQHAASAE